MLGLCLDGKFLFRTQKHSFKLKDKEIVTYPYSKRVFIFASCTSAMDSVGGNKNVSCVLLYAILLF